MMLVTGMGVASPLGTDVATFLDGLQSGRTKFAYLTRPGRTGTARFLGAELDMPDPPPLKQEHLAKYRSASLSSQVAVQCVHQAFEEADLGRMAPERIGLVIGGSNFQQRHHWNVWNRHQQRPKFVPPTYGLSFWDSDIIGLLSECFCIQGEGLVIGAASAGGAAAVIQAARQIEAGVVDASIAVGPLCDLSHWELQGLANLGAMGSERFSDHPELACRPFDKMADGFIFGEGCAALVLEREKSDHSASHAPYGKLLGWSQVMDGHRNPDPNAAGQQRAMQQALRMAKIDVQAIDYVNTHGTGSPLGDAIEVEALKAMGLARCWINATKSLTGHCLTAAGTIEAAATLLQLRHQFLHPNRNLDDPIDPTMNWVGAESETAELNYALSNSFAFGGINVSLVFGRY